MNIFEAAICLLLIMVVGLIIGAVILPLIGVTLAEALIYLAGGG
jgi:hypothetical protein